MSDNALPFIVFATIIIGYQIFRNIARLSSAFFEWISSRDWPETVGRVILSEVRSVSVPRYKRGRRVLPDIVMFTPDVTYEYHVNAQTFQSAKIYIGQNSFLADFEKADSVAQKYSKNKSLRVFYHPEKPELSFLEREVPKGFIGNVLVGVFWLLVVLIIFYIGKQGPLK